MLGDRIREARKKASLTQAELAEKIGVKRSVISKYENGSISPTHATILNIAEALHVLPHELYDESQWREINDQFAGNVGIAFGLLHGILSDEDTSFVIKKAIKDSLPNLDEICEQLPDLVANITTASVESGVTSEIAGLFAKFRGGRSLPNKDELLLFFYFHRLNEKGQAVAVERISELADIPRYQKDHADSSIPTGTSDK